MKFLRKWKYLITGILLLIITVIFVLLKLKLVYEEDKNIQIEQYTEIVKSDEVIDDDVISECTIDIKGAVMNPGVYQLSCSDNVSKAIEEAGGTTDKADTSVINLAKKIYDEMVIIVYTKEEVANSNIVDTVIKVVEKECVCPNIQNDSCINNEITDEITNNNGLVNINTATLEELLTVPGIGEAKAKAILEYRDTHIFNSLDELLNVSGIGQKLYETIKVYLTT